MNDMPWLQKVFGPSPETTVPGIGCVLLAIACIWAGRALDSPDLTLAGITILGVGVAMIAKSARSQAQHDRDKSKGET